MSGVFGIVEITLATGFYANPPDFAVQFRSREETLKYYVVARNYTDGEMGQLSINDNGFADDGRPRVTFTKKDPGSFTADDIAPGLLGGAGAKVVLFSSQAAVARRERARRQIQLTKNGDVLITHLPQPGPDKTNGNMIVHISKP